MLFLFFAVFHSFYRDISQKGTEVGTGGISSRVELGTDKIRSEHQMREEERQRLKEANLVGCYSKLGIYCTLSFLLFKGNLEVLDVKFS